MMPVVLTHEPIDGHNDGKPLPCTAMRDVILDHLFGS